MVQPEPSTSASVDEVEDDLYELLNLTRDASQDQLRTSFRRLSQQYHPDKHVDPAAKTAATNTFTRIKEAYEILFDNKLRRIYDEFGLDAARSAASPALELTPYSDLAYRFRQEANAGNAGKPGVNTPRDAYFTVVNSVEPRVDATGLMVALEDGIMDDLPPFAVITQVALSSMATAYLSQNTTFVAQYSTMSSARSQRSDQSSVGDLTLALRRQLSAYTQAEISAYAPLDRNSSMTFGAKAIRSLSQYMTMSIESAYDPRVGEATTSISTSRIFGERQSASLSWATGSASGVAFQWRREAYDEYIADTSSQNRSAEEENEVAVTDAEDTATRAIRRLHKHVEHLVKPMGIRWSLRLGALDTSLSFVLRRPVGELAPLFKKCEPTGPGGASVKLRAHIGVLGWEVEAGGGHRYVMADTAWGMSVAVGSRGVIWRFKVSRAGHRFQIPVVLVSSTTDARAATLAAIASSLLVSAVNSLLVVPFLKYQRSQERAEAKARRSDFLSKAKQDAEAAVGLMSRKIQTSLEREQAVEIEGCSQAGLIIARAIYGIRETTSKCKFTEASFVGREIDSEVIEVAQCVQALVEDSHIQVVSATKSTLSGFWDPSAFGEKEELALRVWYQFKGELHDCLIADDEPLELPLSGHRVGSWT